MSNVRLPRTSKTALALVSLSLLMAMALVLISRSRADLLDALERRLVRVEEDWALSIAMPDSNRAAPQVSTQMLHSYDGARFCNFHVNFCDVPEFAIGGL